MGYPFTLGECACVLVKTKSHAEEAESTWGRDSCPFVRENRMNRSLNKRKRRIKEAFQRKEGQPPDGECGHTGETKARGKI